MYTDCLQKSTVDNWRQPSKFVYTPMHGVGHATMSKLCASLGIDGIITVLEQEQPDPDFSTVKFPNPEENGALDLAMKTADNSGVTLIVANDPDADRFAAAEKVKYVFFNFFFSMAPINSFEVVPGLGSLEII